MSSNREYQYKDKNYKKKDQSCSPKLQKRTNLDILELSSRLKF